MVELSDLTQDDLDNGEIGLPLPLGLNIPQRTVNARSVITLNASEFKMVDSTDKGWPTLVIGSNNEIDEKLGVAIDYLGSWRNVPVQEADLVLGSDRTWWAVIAFHTADYAVDHANYEIDDYTGYELIDWADFKDKGFEEIQDYIHGGVTPITYTADHPVYEAIAIQQAEQVGTLTRMFNLSRYQTLMNRKERLYKRVIPREERWDKLDTDQFDQLRDLYQSVTSDSDNEDDSSDDDDR